MGNLKLKYKIEWVKMCGKQEEKSEMPQLTPSTLPATL